MTKHHTDNNDAQQNAGDSTVLEGEVLNQHSGSTIEEKIAKGRAYSRSKATDEASATKSGLSADQPLNKSSWLTRYRGYILWMLMFIVVILVLFATRPNTAWQVQHINALQTDVSQLYQDQQLLESRLVAQEVKVVDAQKGIESAIAEALANSENKPLVSQADLDALKKSTEQRLIELQAHLQSLKETATVPLEKAQEATEQLLDSAIEASQATGLPEDAIKPLVEKLQTQIDGLGSKLSELFDFNSQQKTLTSQQALSAFQIQQWIVEINGQWLMQGRAEQTTQQLLALEQAVGLSDFPEMTTLARLIGQDLAHLELIMTRKQTEEHFNTQALQAAVNQLSLKDSKVEMMDNKPASEVHAAASDEKINLGEEISSESALDQLMTRLGQMISLKKRETSAEQTHVESVIMQDVLIQRGLLLVDRIDWALQTKSQDGLSLAMVDLQTFINTHFMKQSQEFSQLLAPLKDVTFELRQPLAILSVQSEW